MCISYWDNKAIYAAAFLATGFLPVGKTEVEKLIYTCETLKEWAKLNYVMRYEFAYYHYPSEIEDTLHAILENHLSVLKQQI